MAKVKPVSSDETLSPTRKSKQISIFKCGNCEFSSRRRPNLIDHIKARHEHIRENICTECSFTSTTKQALRRHIKYVHEKVKDKKCKECEYTASTNRNIRRHTSTVHNKTKDCICHECGKEFSRQESLTTHIKSVHEKVKNHTCKLCAYESYYRSDIISHIKMKHAKVRYSCEECNLQVANKSILNRHKRVKHGARFKCEMCDVAADGDDGENRKCELHTNEIDKSFICEKCDYQTTTQWKLRDHFKCHEKREAKRKRCKFTCTKCDFASNFECSLKVHMRGVHYESKGKPVETLVRCDKCDYTTPERSYMRKHELAMHGEKLHCEFCDFNTCRKERLESHKLAKHKPKENDLDALLGKIHNEVEKKNDVVKKCEEILLEMGHENADDLSEKLSQYVESKPKEIKEKPFVNTWQTYENSEYGNTISKELFNLSNTENKTADHLGPEVLRKKMLGSMKAQLLKGTDSITNYDALSAVYFTGTSDTDKYSARNDLKENASDTEVNPILLEHEDDEITGDNFWDQLDEPEALPKVIDLLKTCLESTPGEFLKKEDLVAGLLKMSKKDSKSRIKLRSSSPVMAAECIKQEPSDDNIDKNENQEEYNSLLLEVSAELNDEKPLICEFCEIPVPNISFLKQHLLLNHVTPEAPNLEDPKKERKKPGPKVKEQNMGIKSCDECEYTSIRWCDLNQHVKAIHRQIRDNKCDECEYKTSDKSTLRRHKKSVHLKILDKKCPYCDHATASSSRLKRHVKNMHDPSNMRNEAVPQNREGMCPECGHFKQNLARHMKYGHKDKVKLTCDKCNYSIDDAPTMRKHVKYVHDRVMDKFCTEDGCDFVTARTGSLNRHLGVVHGGFQKDKECAECEYRTSSKWHLKSHMKGRHGIDPYPTEGKEKPEAPHENCRTKKCCTFDETSNRVYNCIDCNYVALKKCHLTQHRKLFHQDNHKSSREKL